MTIRDNLTPRERQVRETLAGMRDEHGEPTPRARQLEQWWFCRFCRARNYGPGNTATPCIECGRLG